VTKTISPVTPLLVDKGMIRFKYTRNNLNIPFELARIVVVGLSTSAGRLVVLDARMLTVQGEGLGLDVEVCVAAAVGLVGGGIVVVVVVGLEALVG
jgi:hypothetical protein